MPQPKIRKRYVRYLVSLLPGKTSREKLAFWIAKFPDGCGSILAPEYMTTVKHCQWAVASLMVFRDLGIKVNYCAHCLGHIDEPPVSNCKHISTHRAEVNYLPKKKPVYVNKKKIARTQAQKDAYKKLMEKDYEYADN